MKSFIDRIRNSEFLTFNEVLRLKVIVVSLFLLVFVFLTIPLSSVDNFTIDINILIPLGMLLLVLLTFLFTVINLNRFSMHISIWTIILLTVYYVLGSSYFYGYILFFVTLTIIIFYQDILTYIFYGGGVTALGVYYIMQEGETIVGINSTGVGMSTLTYQTILIGFYVVFLIQFLLSDNIYEKLNNEYVRMNKIHKNYQTFSLEHLKDILEQSGEEPLYKNPKFQQTVSEICIFINEFFEKQGDNIAEAVEYFFFLHDQDVEEVVNDSEISITARKYAREFQKYLLNEPSELVSILFDFATLLKENEPYSSLRYEYQLDNIFPDKIDKLLSLAMLYKYLKTEITKLDKWGKITESLTHDEITELFVSKEFREFISFEQVNFYLDNQELFKEFL